MRKSPSAFLPKDASYILCVVLWAIWLALEYFAFGANSHVRLHNVADESLPQLISLGAYGGLFSNWRPEWATGADRATLPFSTDLNVLPFLILCGWLANACVMLLQRLIAGLFTFLLLRDELSVSKPSSLLAAMLYALYSQPNLNRGLTGFTYYDYLAIPGVPLVLWLLSRARKKSSSTAAVIGAAAGVFIALAGSLHISLFVGAVVVFWFWLVRPFDSKSEWITVLFFFGAWAAVAIPINLPQAILARTSTRYTYDLVSIWGGTAARVRGTAHIFWENLLPVTLIGLGFAASKARDKTLNWLILMISLFAIFRCAYYPIADSLRPITHLFYALNLERIVLMLPFLFAAASGVGLDCLLTQLNRHGRIATLRAQKIALGALILFVCIQSLRVKAETINQTLQGQNYRAYYLNPDLLALKRELGTKAQVRLATIAVAEDRPEPKFPPGALWAYGFETADGFLNIQSQRYRAYWAKILEPSMERDASLSAWVNLWGCQLNLFVQSTSADGENIELTNRFNMDLLSLIDVGYIVSPTPINDSRLELLPSQARAEQLAWRRKSTRAKLFSLVSQTYPGTPLYIYRNTNSVPRYFLAQRVRVASSPDEVLSELSHSSVQELSTVAYVEKSDSNKVELSTSGPSGTDNVAVLRYDRDTIELGAELSSPRVLVAMNSYSPYWHAEIDGKPKPLFPVNEGFQGVSLPAGRHRIVYRYQRPHWF